MGADIKQLRTRIKSVDSTLHLTEAMGLVASSKMRKSNEAMQKSREYERALEGTVSMLASCNECKKSPYMAERETKRTRLVVIAGDRGLAGGYNANIFRLVKELLAECDAEIIPIGKRSCDRFAGELLYAEDFGYAQAKTLATRLCEDFAEGKFDRLGIVCTRYHSMMSQEATVRYVLPLKASGKTSKASAIFEPDEVTVLNAAIPEYLAGILVSCVKESFASEVAARRFAMDAAGKNAREMLSDLGLAYNRARQGAITQEITEIVAGSGM